MNFRALAVVGMAIVSIFAADSKEPALGKVTVDAKGRAISFPARVNMREGQVEYLLVHDSGKVHESIFRTDVMAAEIHAAALLFSEGATNSAPKLKVEGIDVSWRTGDGKKKFTAAELILDREKKRALRETKWAYRGSRLIDGVFLAQRDGQLIGIMQDRDALVDQDTPEAVNDENWEPMKDLLPAVGAEVTIAIRFAK
jgi:hypothetical protein